LIDIKTNVVFRHLEQSKKRFVVEQGGTRSGKTFNILIWIIFRYAMTHTGKTITICRKSSPSLRGTVARDFWSILEKHNLYKESHHRKSTNEYMLNGNLVEFLNCDVPQKIRGRKRSLLFINEANELTYEDFFQLNIRTTEKVIVDYNPSDEYHWLYEKLIPRDDCEFHQTTYLDNPFLDEITINEIERLKDVDANYWRVYGLGERGISDATIFTHWKESEEVPESYKLKCLGIDWGYTNDPTAIVACYSNGNDWLIDERCYATRMTNFDISEFLRGDGWDKNVTIICDSAEPKSIAELHGYGWNVHGARKGADSIRSGIDYMKSRGLMITNTSLNAIKEFRNYKWKEDRDGKKLNEPVDAFNHIIDASRYAITFHQTNPNFGRYTLG
jgi:phage terminase large subunit